MPERDWIASNTLAFAVPDGFPVSKGHTLIVPKRVVATWWDASQAEHLAMLELLNNVRAILDGTLSPRPDGYNVGFNAGEAAG